MRDPYDVLGVPKTASAADIKKAYRQLAKKFHPDRNRDDTKAKERFAEINTAYEIVGDEKKKAQFDRGEIGPDGKPRGFEGFGAGPGGFSSTGTSILGEGGGGAGSDLSSGFGPSSGRGLNSGRGTLLMRSCRSLLASISIAASIPTSSLTDRKGTQSAIPSRHTRAPSVICFFARWACTLRAEIGPTGAFLIATNHVARSFSSCGASPFGPLLGAGLPVSLAALSALSDLLESAPLCAGGPALGGVEGGRAGMELRSSRSSMISPHFLHFILMILLRSLSLAIAYFCRVFQCFKPLFHCFNAHGLSFASKNKPSGLQP